MDDVNMSAMAERTAFVPLLQSTNELAVVNTISGGKHGEQQFTRIAQVWLRRLISVANLSELTWGMEVTEHDENGMCQITARAADCEFRLTLSLAPRSNEMRMLIVNSGEVVSDVSVHALRNIHALKSVVEHIRLDPEEVSARTAATADWLFGGMEA